jgi:hypothetical protein
VWIMMALLFVLAATPEPDNATGVAHSTVQGMAAGGDGAARLAPVYVPAALLHGAFLLLVGVLAVLGAPAGRRLRLAPWLAAVGIVSLLVWWRILATHADALASSATGYVLGLPESSLWMLLGTWSAGCLFAVVYVAGFRRFVLTPADEAEYERLVARGRPD